MSECPGTSLEDYVAWRHHLHSDNESPYFKKLVAIYEPIRETIENALLNFNDELNSWRGYASNLDDYVTSDMESEIKKLDDGCSSYVENSVVSSRTTEKGKVLVNDNHNYIKIGESAPWGLKCILINRPAGVGYIGILNKRDKFPTHYCPMPTFID